MTFTSQAQRILDLATSLAADQGCRRVNTCFVLLAACRDSPQIKKWLKEQGVLPQRIAKRLPPKRPAFHGNAEPTDECRRVMDLAQLYAGDEPAGPLHLLCAILAAEPECEASRVLRRCGLRQPKTQLPSLVRQPTLSS